MRISAVSDEVKRRVGLRLFAAGATLIPAKGCRIGPRCLGWIGGQDASMTRMSMSRAGSAFVISMQQPIQEG